MTEPSIVRRLAAWLWCHGWIRLAREVSCFAPFPTDRAHLLIAPTERDVCPAFSTVPTTRDCGSDGHYLCRACTRLMRCEGCGAPAAGEDSMGVPLCDKCLDALEEVDHG